jgi:hypothetical protein
MTICYADHGHGKVGFADQALILKPLPETVGEACLGFNGRLADDYPWDTLVANYTQD